MSGDEPYLAHIDRSIRRIEASRVAHGGADLVAGTEQADATLFRLATVGESVKHLSLEVKDAHPEVPWRQVTGFRDHLVHNVLALDMDTVRDVVRDDLPGLGAAVRRELDLARRPDRSDDIALGL